MTGQRSDSLPDPRILAQLGEWFAAGYFELPEATPLRRWSRAVRRRLEHQTLSSYGGETLYPSGPRRAALATENLIVAPSYSYTWTYHRSAWRSTLETATRSSVATLRALDAAMSKLESERWVWDSPHTVGGRGYTHSIPNYGRVLHEGLDGYAARIEARLAAARQRGDSAPVDLYLGLLDVVAGIRAWHRRIVEHLAAWEPATSQEARQRDALLAAFWQVPFEPARSFYEALVAYNFIFYLDDCDNPGRLDRELEPYYRRDMDAGRLGRGNALAWMRQFTDNVATNDAWSAAIGGSQAGGEPAYGDVTLLCLEAVHDRHRPSYELAVRDDMPDEVWSAALDAVATGCGQPAFYNESGYLAGLREADLGIRDEDLVWWNGGGCTETMIHGRSNVGSLDAGINLVLILEKTLRRHLSTVGTFVDLLAHYRADVDAVVRDVMAGVNRLQQAKAKHAPQPMRSLLVDDCIDRGVEFHAGGARYNWSVINVAGLANVADSLAAVREVVFDRQELSGAVLMGVLDRDFADAEPLRQRLRRCPRFGNGLSTVDDLAADVAQHVYDRLLSGRPWRGGRFLPSCIMFTTYAEAGLGVGATPDGRRAGEPLADSIGPVSGRDRQGPTAMLRSVSRLPLRLAVGTPVLNIRFGKSLFASSEGRCAIRDLIRTYFEMGGMQIQLSVVDREVLEDALLHPERHEDLIVRVGGFSAYFNTLSPALKQAILERTEHTL